MWGRDTPKTLSLMVMRNTIHVVGGGLCTAW